METLRKGTFLKLYPNLLLSFLSFLPKAKIMVETKIGISIFGSWKENEVPGFGVI